MMCAPSVSPARPAPSSGASPRGHIVTSAMSVTTASRHTPIANPCAAGVLKVCLGLIPLTLRCLGDAKIGAPDSCRLSVAVGLAIAYLAGAFDGERTFSAPEFVAEANREGAGLTSRCEGAITFVCYRAANVVLRVESDDPLQLARIEAAIRGMER
jgi:hypothetical protein